jgi:hypothetical protein
MRTIRHQEHIMKRPASIIGAAVICVIALIVYFGTRPPGGVTPMDGESSATIAWISLAVAALSLATAVVGLIQKLVELRAGNRR